MKNIELAKRIRAVAELRGDFLLRSGARSALYFDKYQFESDPALLRDIAELMCQLLAPDVEVVAGLEMGGILLAVMIGQLQQLPTAFIRKAAKTYGTCRLAEGAELRERRIVLVEDVVTSGGAVLDAARALRAEGVSVTDVVCAIERAGKGRSALAAAQLRLHAVFTEDDL